MVREIYTALDKSGKEVDPSTDAASLLGILLEQHDLWREGGAYAIQSAPGAEQSSVVRVDHAAYSASIGTPPVPYLATLTAEYGTPKAQLGPEVINAAESSSAHTYKWLFARNGGGADCAPRSTWRGHEEFRLAAPGGPWCATQLTVRVASTPSSVIQADFKLLNLSAIVQAHDRFVASLNQKYGTHFADAKTAYAQAKEAARLAAASSRAATGDAEGAAEAAAQEDKNRVEAAFALFVVAALAQAVSNNTPSGSSGGFKATAPKPVDYVGDDEHRQQEANQRREDCRRRCDRPATECMMGDEYQSCLSRRRNDVGTCNELPVTGSAPPFSAGAQNTVVKAR